MATVLIVAYLLIVVAMIVVILLQRSEGGGLGMGGGGGLMTARGSANLLTRTTAILGTLFMVTAVALTIVSQVERSSNSILNQVRTDDGSTPSSVLEALDAMSAGNDDLVVPAQPVPAQPDLAVPATPNADLAVPEVPSESQTTGN